MATRKLPNYLRTYRRRASLSQEEVAYLIGACGGPKVCRYERASRRPSLETALAYEALFGIPARDLFAGVYEKVEGETRRRAKQLIGRLGPASSLRAARKLAALSVTAGSPERESATGS